MIFKEVKVLHLIKGGSVGWDDAGAIECVWGVGSSEWYTYRGSGV